MDVSCLFLSGLRVVCDVQSGLSTVFMLCFVSLVSGFSLVQLGLLVLVVSKNKIKFSKNVPNRSSSKRLLIFDYSTSSLSLTSKKK